ncbi:uncharacterized protein LOC134408179 [Elgaria multicarinata webbii]|uniref:uncharacterized protein LOC134408179 n=1 Tax=Elgaria multicarinata webbii TaxID=159646 RepID=UPI002FCCF9B7
MKILVVMLALAMAAGSKPFTLGGQSDSRLAKLVRDTKEHKQNISFVFFKTLIEIDKSEVGRELQEKIRPVISKLSVYLNKLGRELSSEASNTYGLIGEVSRGVLDKGQMLLNGARRKMRPETEKFSEILQSYTEPFLERVEPSIKSLLSSLSTMTEEVDTKLNKNLSEWLGSFRPWLSPYIIGFEKFHESLVPVANQLQEAVRRRMEGFHRQLWSHFGHILVVFEKHRQEFREWVDRPVFPQDQ